MQNLKPMDAVVALFSNGHQELSEAIVASLSRAIFNGIEIRPAGWVQRTFARASCRILQWTTTISTTKDENGAEVRIFSNALLERSRHPYAKSLLASSRSETASLVEGGDAMNANYMMIAPEIRMNSGLWDRVFLDSVQGKDVRLRMALETRATYEIARRWLETGEPVRLKAVAAGTGLSMILVYDRLIRDGCKPDLISATITDKEEANIDKANRLLDKLATTRERKCNLGREHGISANTEDIFVGNGNDGAAHTGRYDVVTAIGILEYFQGFSCCTTEQRLKIESPVESATARDLATRLCEMTTDRASLIVNTYRDDASTRILEVFGRKFDYRNRQNLRLLLASANFRPARLVGSGNIYDVEVYEKNPSPVDSVAPSAIRGRA
jgi:hypothetical protein